MINFQSDLVPATLIKRYKRFLADVRDRGGREFTVHCPNTGAMTGCGTPGDHIWLSESNNPKRKYAHTWELTQTNTGAFICVNTQQANRVVGNSLRVGLLGDFFKPAEVNAEQMFPAGHGRADYCLTLPSGKLMFLEVKSCTLAEKGVGMFPDTTSVRALKHVNSLVETKLAGYRSAMLFAVMRTDVGEVTPAYEIDPAYAAALNEAVKLGVEVYAVSCEISPKGLEVKAFIPVRL